MTFSIVVPTLNRLATLRELVDSLQAQTCREWELLVVDDGSTDGTVEHFRLLAERDPRIACLPRTSQPSGANHCRNIGLRAASGEYVIFLDSDDQLSAACLGGRAEAMASHPELDFGVFPHRHFEKVPGDLGSFRRAIPDQDDIEAFLKVDVPWQTAGPTWRRQSLAKVGAWNEGLRRWQDWEFHVRALALGLRYRCFDAPAFFHRVGGGRAAISLGTGKEHLVDQAAAITSGARALQECKKLTHSRRALIPPLYLTLAEALARRGDEDGARSLWSRAAADLPMSFASVALGSLVLKTARVPVLRTGTRLAFRLGSRVTP
jgi:glycosyltransferase involved in cell wall biosynthesis